MTTQHGARLTATSTEELSRYSTVYLVGSMVRHATDADKATHFVPRDYPANASATIIALEFGHKYRCILSGACSADETLLQDDGGLLSPSATGPKVGRAAAAGAAGDIIEFIYEPSSLGGGDGVSAGEVNQLIDAAISRSYNFSPAADDTPPTDIDWPEGNPDENDILEIIRTPSDTRKRSEWYIRDAVGTWTQIHFVAGAGGMSEPERSEFRAIQDIIAGTAINTNAATAGETVAIGLDYTSHDTGTAATFNDLYGNSFIAYVNGLKVQQDDILRNDGDPAGYVRFNFDIPADAEIMFESQVIS